MLSRWNDIELGTGMRDVARESDIADFQRYGLLNALHGRRLIEQGDE
jgi:hypothetical protein